MSANPRPWRVGGHVDLGEESGSQVVLRITGAGPANPLAFNRNTAVTVERRMSPDEAESLARQLLDYANIARQIQDKLPTINIDPTESEDE